MSYYNSSSSNCSNRVISSCHVSTMVYSLVDGARRCSGTVRVLDRLLSGGLSIRCVPHSHGRTYGSWTEKGEAMRCPQSYGSGVLSSWGPLRQDVDSEFMSSSWHALSRKGYGSIGSSGEKIWTHGFLLGDGLRHRKNVQLYARRKSSERSVQGQPGGKCASPTHQKTFPDDGEFSCAIEVKKSKFVAFARHVDSEQEALDFISNVRDPSASHTCWAIRIGQRVCRCSDDGEPSGTAGKPILNTIESMNLDEVCVAVVRYYGGIKLGSGGLCRAYAGAARELLQQIPLEEIIPTRIVSIIVPTELLGVAFHTIEIHGGKNVQEDFDEDHGDRFVVQFDVDEAAYEGIMDHLRESSRGKIKLSDDVSISSM